MRPSRRLWLGALVLAIGLGAGTATRAVFVAHSAPAAPAASKPAPFATVVRQAQQPHEPPAQLAPQILYATPPPGLTPLPVRVTATATPTPSPTPTASPTASPTATPSATATARPTSSATPTPAPTASPTAAPQTSVTATPGP